MGNILQNSLDVTYDDFLKGVFGVKHKPERNALKTLFSEIVTGKSTLVSDLSKPLRANASKAECKRAQERSEEHENEKKARMNKSRLAPNERDW